MISIVTPVYNEEGNVVYFHDEVTKVMKGVDMDYEIIYVNDGSKDRTDELIHQLADSDPHVRALTFARNFGHQIAITCGMDFAIGDAVITMDGDMQHPPELIPKLIEKWQEGYDIDGGCRAGEEDDFGRVLRFHQCDFDDACHSRRFGFPSDGQEGAGNFQEVP